MKMFLAACAAALVGSSASAAVIDYKLSGYIGEIRSTNGYKPLWGMPVEIAFTLDTDRSFFYDQRYNGTAGSEYNSAAYGGEHWGAQQYASPVTKVTYTIGDIYRSFAPQSAFVEKVVSNMVGAQKQNNFDYHHYDVQQGYPATEGLTFQLFDLDSPYSIEESFSNYTLGGYVSLYRTHALYGSGIPSLAFEFGIHGVQFSAVVREEVPAPVPLPAAGFLMLAGLSALGAAKFRRTAGVKQ